MFAERTIQVDGIPIHVWHGGKGFPILLLHGVGPGTSAAANFGKVREALAERYSVWGTDLAGFGKSGRKTAPPYFDYGLWRRQSQAVLDLLPAGDVGVVGHSVSGTLALRLAAADKRVARVLVTCPMGAPLAPNPFRDRLWTFPENREDLRKSLEALFADHSTITDELIESRLAVLQAPGYGEYFRKVFGGDKQALIEPTILTEDELSAVTCPVSIIHGRNDLPFPAEETSYRLLEHLPQADMHLIARCGHGPAAERPDTFLAIAREFFG